MTGHRRVLAAGLLVLAACTTQPAPSPTESPSFVPSPLPTVSLPSPDRAGESAAEARTRLCQRPEVPEPEPAPPAGDPSPAIAEVIDHVESVRELEFLRPVRVDAVTHEELVAGIDESFEHSFPRDLYARRSLAWDTIGVIPDGTDLRSEYEDFFAGQVIGYYDPATNELVFIGSESPSALERLTLAHELTHAIDDQHFGLARINDLENGCREEELMAALGIIEGSAQHFSFQVALEFFTPADAGSLLLEDADFPTDIDPFLVDLQLWPYIDGMAFVQALVARGGVDAVNEALTDLPTTTEQVMHPEKYPQDVPDPIDVLDLDGRLGRGWEDIDVMEVGEEWIRAMLDLREGDVSPADAAAGWDGGQYRAWSDGDHVAVLLETAWDAEGDAAEFTSALQQWIEEDQPATLLSPGAADHVLALFASDPSTLDLLVEALSAE